MKHQYDNGTLNMGNMCIVSSAGPSEKDGAETQLARSQLQLS